MTWVKFSAMIDASPLGAMSRNGATNVPPALFTSTSTRSKRSAIDSTKASTASGSRTSSSALSTGRPSPSMSAATSASRSAWRSQIATVAPHRANRRAVARPIPWAAPVTTATRSVSRMESASKRSPVVMGPLCHARPTHPPLDPLAQYVAPVVTY